jgi:transposase
MRLCERGGKNAKKRAAVAVARKLAVLLHRLWMTGEVYEPLRQDTLTKIPHDVAA